MFQTNQGPSFPAHQFLFSGTSAPIEYNDPDIPCGTYPCYQWFDAENTGSASGTNGCIAYHDVHARDIDPASDAESYTFIPETTVSSPGFPCYDHPSLPTLLGNTVSWKYYARGASDLWTAPTAIDPICQTTGYGDRGGRCSGSDWNNNVQSVLPTSSDAAPFLTDIENCNLPQVSWVIPDGNWSDHSGWIDPGDAGPSWVAAIVNAIGQDTICEGGKGYWSDTVILITWDDWGGLYDDVVPPDCPGPQPCTGYFGTNGSGNGQQYVYGFRVPLLVVSAYAKQKYISGLQNNPDCIHNTYCHDFGSILNFIEYAFGQGGQPLGTIGDPHWPYADALVMDTSAPPNNFSLYDFFNFNQIQTPTFTPITGWKYGPNCFHTPTAPHCFTTYPVDPDNDANED